MTMMRAIRKRRWKGQSVTEFALMMPVIMAFFFYAFEANIHMSAMQQASYASYMGARGFLVKRQGRGDPNTIGRMILTGRIFTEMGTAPSFSQENDGVTLRYGRFASLPWSRKLFEGWDAKMPTHLGKNEYDGQWGSDPKQSHNGTNRRITDNNAKDH